MDSSGDAFPDSGMQEPCVNDFRKYVTAHAQSAHLIPLQPKGGGEGMLAPPPLEKQRKGRTTGPREELRDHTRAWAENRGENMHKTRKNINLEIQQSDK